MRHLILSLILLFSISACEDHKAQEEKTKLLAQLQAKEESLKQARLETKIANEKLLAQEKAQKEAFIKNQEKKAQEVKQSRQNEKLSNVGISIQKDTITIDTNKTKDFFTNIGKTLETKLKKITTDMKKGMIDDNDTGIKIDKSHINIDLNKTKDFLELWGEKMQGFVKDIDNMAKEFDIQTVNKSENK